MAKGNRSPVKPLPARLSPRTLSHDQIDLGMLFIHLYMHLFGVEGVRGERPSIFGYNVLFRLSGASTELNSCISHKSRAATAPTSGGIFTERQLRVFLSLRSQRSHEQLLVTAQSFL